ncbi:hypothetical protein RKD41_000426 [Streptomyces tendae]
MSQASLSGSVNVERVITGVELLGPDRPLVYDTAGIDHEECRPVLRHEFATAVRTGTSAELDARYGVRLQKLLDGIVFVRENIGERIRRPTVRSWGGPGVSP